MSRDWDKELAKIDRQLESISDDQLVRPPAGAPAGTPPGTLPPEERQALQERRERTSSFPALARLGLATALGIGILFWPYAARCGTGLALYLGAVAAVVVAGGWSAVWTWRHRTARAHVLSLLLVVWGLVLGAIEILPRTGYAIPTPAHPAIWACE